MNKTLVGICAYGGLKFLELGLAALREQSGFDVLVIVAKPGDSEMIASLEALGVPYLQHSQNLGFPAAINDMYDAAFSHGEYNNLIIMGNDVIPLTGTIEAMIQCAETTDFEMVCGSEYDVRFLCEKYPEARKHFDGSNLVVKQSAIEQRIWEIHKDSREGVEPDTRKDIRNLTLFKRSTFEKVGYADVSYWPNGYFEDVEYCRRCDLLGVSACGLKEAAFFHWWSRTIHEGEGRDNGKFFRRNEQHYKDKWAASPELKISTRDQESAIINHWANL